MPRGLIVTALCAGLGACGLATLGVDPTAAGPASLVLTLLDAGPFVLAWLLAALGIGRLALRLVPLEGRGDARDASLVLEAALGAACLLWLAHVMGVLGALRAGPLGTALGWGPIALGAAFLLLPARGVPGRVPDDASHIAQRLGLGWPSWPIWVAGAPALAVLLYACCVPPGLLWRSEAGQFDTLSYHLQLPREWLAMGRLWPVDHNAYSWLPSYVEASFLHVAALGASPATALSPRAIIGAQLLHAALAVLAALLVAGLARRWCEQMAGDANGVPDPSRITGRAASLLAGTAAGGLLLATPWTVVVGSCAYNEMAVLLCFVAALWAALPTGPGASESTPVCFRAMWCGFLVGVACGCKPTALFMVGPVVGLALLAGSRPRQWPALILWACLAGLVALAPYLARNWLACGNPVFPYAVALLGGNEASTLSLTRWADGHSPEGTIVERVALLFRERGLLHIQWGVTPACAIIGACVALFGVFRGGPGRVRLLVLLAGVVTQVGAWLVLGHQQSRFLMPLLVPAALLTGLGIFALATWAARVPALRWPVALLAAAPVLAGSVFTGVVLARESPSRLGPVLVTGPAALSGDLAREQWATMSTEQKMQVASDAPPNIIVNLTMGPRPAAPVLKPGAVARVLLVGDSTPLYIEGAAPGGPLYHTTWNDSPLGIALRRAGGDTALAARMLAAPPPAGQGVTHLLVNFDELGRLQREGWYDPDVTPEFVQRFIDAHGKELRAWGSTPAQGQRLVELRPASPAEPMR